jgi:hypothetical protein
MTMQDDLRNEDIDGYVVSPQSTHSLNNNKNNNKSSSSSNSNNKHMQLLNGEG